MLYQVTKEHLYYVNANSENEAKLIVDGQIMDKVLEVEPNPYVQAEVNSTWGEDTYVNELPSVVFDRVKEAVEDFFCFAPFKKPLVDDIKDLIYNSCVNEVEDLLK